MFVVVVVVDCCSCVVCRYGCFVVAVFVLLFCLFLLLLLACCWNACFLFASMSALLQSSDFPILIHRSFSLTPRTRRGLVKCVLSHKFDLRK